MDNFFDTRNADKPPGFTAAGDLLRGLIIGFLWLVIVLLGLAAASYSVIVNSHKDALGQRYPDLVQNSLVYDLDGKPVGEFRAAESRQTVGSKDISENLARAVVAIEDQRFYQHRGVDFEGIGRALWTDVRARGIQEGGSTVTEQLMKNLFIPPDQRGSASPWRRFTQASLAVAYERQHSKTEILTSYLNTVYFGDGAYGAEVAAQRYFGKSARDLTLPEAATLAGFLHSPSNYRAKGEVGLATARRNEVLKHMQEQGMISASQLAGAESTPVVFSPAPPPENPDYQPFLEKVRRDVEARLGPESLKQGGLRIYTTLDPALQETAVSNTAAVLDQAGDPSAALVSVEPATGAIRALTGQSQGFNLALDARRQPGSAFKPFVLAAALKENISPKTLYVSKNLNLNLDGRKYAVKNYGGVQRGTIPVDTAMAASDNTVFVQFALDIGLQKVVQAATEAGITTPLDPYPSTALGGLRVGVSALDMASAYATFAAGGIHRTPYSVERVDRESFGQVSSLYRHAPDDRRVMSANQAAAETQVLRGVVQRGTASQYHYLDSEIGRPSAGKTGTTDDFVDAWYVGYTPQLSTAVWVGYPEGRRPMQGVHGLPVVNGENFPLDIWAAYMRDATAGTPVTAFPVADMSGFKRLTTGYAVAANRYLPVEYPASPEEIQRQVQGVINRVFGDVFGTQE